MREDPNNDEKNDHGTGKEGNLQMHAVLVREIMAHAFKFDAPGYVMLISADVMFWYALLFLHYGGFKVLLAHDRLERRLSKILMLVNI